MQKNYKTLVKGIVVCSLVIYVIIILLFRRQGTYSIETLFGDIGYTSSIVLLLVIVFNRFFWKIGFVGKLLKTPNLNGVWEGTGHSNYNGGIDYPVKLKIKQTFLNTNIHAVFEKSESDSFNAVFINDETRDITHLIYSYQNDPKLDYRDKAEEGKQGGLNIHYGTVRLKIDFDDLTHLTGHYWNDRKYTGTLKLTKKG